MKYVSRLNQWLDKAVSNAQEKLANKRLAKKASLLTQSEINRIDVVINEIEESIEQLKNSKNFNARDLWAEEKNLMMLHKEREYYIELKKELF